MRGVTLGIPYPGFVGMSRLVGLAAALVAAAPAAAQNVHPTTPPEVRAVVLQEPIRLDGKLDEAVWQTAPPAIGFRQSTAP